MIQITRLSAQKVPVAPQLTQSENESPGSKGAAGAPHNLAQVPPPPTPRHCPLSEVCPCFDTPLSTRFPGLVAVTASHLGYTSLPGLCPVSGDTKI